MALAHPGLADALSYFGRVELAPPNEVMPKARWAAEAELRIDSGLGEAHTSLGILKLGYESDVSGTGKEPLPGLELAPGGAYCRHWYKHHFITRT